MSNRKWIALTLLAVAGAMGDDKGPASKMADETATAATKSRPSTKETKADLPEMVTDRPDFTESAEVVGKNVMQTEMGTAFERDVDGRSKSLLLGTPLMRWGLGKRFEIRIGGGEGLISNWSQQGRNRGFSDGELGFKYKFRDESKWLPSLAVMPSLSMPIGVAAFTNGAYDPGVKIAWGKEAPFGFALSGNLNAARITSETGRFVQKAVTLSVSHDLIAGFGGYWEAYAFAPFERQSAPAWVFDTGVTRMAGKNVQFDVTYGHRANKVGPNWFVSGGISFRKKIPGLFGL